MSQNFRAVGEILLVSQHLGVRQFLIVLALVGADPEFWKGTKGD